MQETIKHANTRNLAQRGLFEPQLQIEFGLNFRSMLKAALSYGLFNAVSNSMMSFQFAGVFYAGGKFMEQGLVTLIGVYR